MRLLGFFLITFGIAGVICALSMDVSVSTSIFSERVNNTGLMNDRLIYIWISCSLFISGVVLAAVGRGYEETVKCPFCAEKISTEAIKCKHCGEKLDSKEPTKKDTAMYSASEFTKYNANNVLILDEAAIERYAQRLATLMPGYGAESIMTAYGEEVKGITGKMSADMAQQFERKIKETLSHIENNLTWKS